MPDNKCSKCGTIFVLPFVRTSDHAVVKKFCPWCNQAAYEKRIGPNSPTYGPIQLAQMQVDKDNEPGVGVMVKPPTDSTPKSPMRMTETERAAFAKEHGPKGNLHEQHPTKPRA